MAARPHPALLLLSRRDVQFQLYDWLDAEALTERERFAEHSRETFDAVLDLCAEIAAERFAPHNKAVDAQEPVLVDGRCACTPTSRSRSRPWPRPGCSTAAWTPGSGACSCPISC